MTAWKSQQFCGEFLQPSGTSRKPNRAACKQIALRNHARSLVGFGLVNGHVDRLLTQALDETAADRGIFDQQRGRTIAFLKFDHLAFERIEGKAAAHNLENIEDLFPPQQHDAGRIIAGFGFAQRDIPAKDNSVAGLPVDFVIGRQPFALDDGAAGRDRTLLVLCRKGDRAHFALELGEYGGGLLLWVEKLALLADVSTTLTKDEGFLSLGNRWQVQHLEATLLLQVAGKIILVHPLHD